MKNLSQIFDRFRAAGLKLSPQKCTTFQKSVTFLGHVVSEFGISTDPAKVVAVKNWPGPGCVKEVRSFLGFCSYYRKFIKDFATIAKPLVKLTEKNVKFCWTDECKGSFNRLKGVMTEAPVLAYPDMSQVYDGNERVIGYFSKLLSKTERRYCVTRRELLAVVEAVKHFHHYLYGVPFEIRSDHGSLRWLLN